MGRSRTLFVGGLLYNPFSVGRGRVYYVTRSFQELLSPTGFARDRHTPNRYVPRSAYQFARTFEIVFRVRTWRGAPGLGAFDSSTVRFSERLRVWLTAASCTACVYTPRVDKPRATTFHSVRHTCVQWNRNGKWNGREKIENPSFRP